jgi:hypothetical protein
MVQKYVGLGLGCVTGFLCSKNVIVGHVFHFDLGEFLPSGKYSPYVPAEHPCSFTLLPMRAQQQPTHMRCVVREGSRSLLTAQSSWLVSMLSRVPRTGMRLRLARQVAVWCVVGSIRSSRGKFSLRVV